MKSQKPTANSSSKFCYHPNRIMTHPLRHYPTNKITITVLELTATQRLAARDVRRNHPNNVAPKKRKIFRQDKTQQLGQQKTETTEPLLGNQISASSVASVSSC